MTLLVDKQEKRRKNRRRTGYQHPTKNKLSTLWITC
ncbi:MAG: hypothetical protein HGB06_03175 [Chlorobaculum sp.]|nr:hypothetical protein [Chlorobaculum sp.]